MGRIIMHVDVNSAYLSWEAADRLQHGDALDLRKIPSVIGGNEASRHGIVLAKSSPAKKYNIQTGESLYAARQKCPNLVVVPPRYDLYMRCSKALQSLLVQYSDKVKAFSIDECFLDYTQMSGLLGNPVAVADEIRQRCRKELGFTINIGISTSKLLAKMGGDLKKPDQTITLYPEEIPFKLWPLPVEELYMCGRATAPKLRQMGIRTIGDLAGTDVSILKYRFKSFGNVLWNYANGIEATEIQSSAPAIKGVGNSTTTAVDVNSYDHAHMILLALSESVGARLRAGGWSAGLISVSCRNTEFVSISKQRAMSYPSDNTTAIYETARKTFDELWNGESLRHMGIRASQLITSEGMQYSLFQKDVEKNQVLDKAIDDLRNRFGKTAVQRGVFLNSGVKPIIGGVGEDDYQMMSSML